MNTALPFRGYNSLEESLKQSILKTVSGCFRFYSNGLSFQFSHFLPHSSVLLILSNTWSRSNLLPLFLWAPPFPQSCFFSSFFSTMGLILERENCDFDSILLTPTPSKMCFLCFQLWSLNSYIFQEEASLAASVAPWASPDSHPILLTTPCLYPGLFSFSLSPECFWPPNPKPLFSPLPMLPLHLIVMSTPFCWISHCFSKSSSSTKELLVLLPAPVALSPVFSATLKFGISFVLFHFIFLYVLRLPLKLFAYAGTHNPFW